MFDETTLSAINQLTVAALAVIACIALWRAYNGIQEKRFTEVASATQAHIDDLRKINTEQYADLKVRILLIEDKLGISRSARINYSDQTIEVAKVN